HDHADHDHGQNHEYAHGHDHPHDHGEHGASHPQGFTRFLSRIFVPHSHGAADLLDDAMEARTEGHSGLEIGLGHMLATTEPQAVDVAFSGSVALLAVTIHNLSDALTAVPLWIAFVLSRRVATRKYTYGFNRAEDLAGLFIVLMIALSAVI